MLDLRDRLRGHRDDLTPPRSLHFVGGGDFRAIGRAYFEHFVNVGGLKSSDSVLDIGCGTGRMAIPMIDYIESPGRYLGFDISQKAIAWCAERITAKNPRFTFAFADIYNLEYNPSGRTSASTYRFPCDDASVDFAFATSVFTHLLPADANRYLAEIRRCLKPNGKAMLTFFVIDQTAASLVAEGRATMDLSTKIDGCVVVDKKTPERAVGFAMSDLTEMVQTAGLKIREPILWGSWSGRPSMLEAQDVVIVGRA
jgi:SAM-dependent methyltransferase